MLVDALSTFPASRDIAPLQASIVEAQHTGWAEQSGIHRRVRFDLRARLESARCVSHAERLGPTPISARSLQARYQEAMPGKHAAAAPNIVTEYARQMRNEEGGARWNRRNSFSTQRLAARATEIPVSPMHIRRRDLLAGTALLALSSVVSRATVISGKLPWAPNAGDPPTPVEIGPWHYFTGPEGRAMEAIADRVIPPDPETP
jgi:hypothetical protein